MRLIPIALLALSLLPTGALQAQTAAAFNYGEALQKSIFFFDVQRAGPLGGKSRVNWRGDSALEDGKEHGVDLTGGWYDAGDHVKFGFPMAGSATLLAWSLIETPSAYADTKQLGPALDNLRWVTDYFLKASATPDQLWGQVGNGNADHAWWGSAEVMAMSRPAYKVTADCPGSDLAGETAAALASASMVFRSNGDAAYATTLLQRAESLYRFADTYRGKYSDCITDAAAFYRSWSGYIDELTWAAAWLYRASGKEEYLTKAKALYLTLPLETGTRFRPYKWTHAWDDKSFGTYVLMAQLTGDSEYRQDAERWLDYWTTGFEGQKVRYTPGGLAWLDQWGSLRYAANTSFLAFLYGDWLTSKNLDSEKASRYISFAERQTQYILGENPRRSSYVIGFGANPPKNPHHRTAHGSWGDSISTPAESAHTLFGALVGGPNASDAYKDDRSDFVANEVATDYNAAFTGALARMVKRYGGTPLDGFPRPEQPTREEIFVQAKINAHDKDFTEVAAYIYNQTAWPARVTDGLSLRYFFTLDSGTASDLTAGAAFNECSKPSAPQLWADKVYYVEVDCTGVRIAPGGQSAFQKQIQLRVSSKADWDQTNDWSAESLTSSALTKTSKIAVYDRGVLVWGEEPQGGTPRPFAILTPSDLPAAIAAKAYSVRLRASGGKAPYGHWDVSRGELPKGVTLNAATGEVAGIPLTDGTYSFALTIADATGEKISREFKLVIDPAPPLVITTSTLRPAFTARAYTQVLAAEGGLPPYRWSLKEGRLPNGLVLEGGTISGSAQAAGPAVPLTIEAADQNGRTAEKVYSLKLEDAAATGAGELRAQYRAGQTSATANQIGAHFRIANTGSGSVPLAELTLRYYFTAENPKPMNFWCDWAVVGCGNVKARFVEMSAGRYYLELGFAAETSLLAAGSNSGDIQIRVAKEDWSNFDQSDDYSFDAGRSDYADTERVTVHQNGNLIWGTAP